jgi:hypothetical protein
MSKWVRGPHLLLSGYKMMTFKLTWDWTKRFCVKLWGQIKKIPGWVFFIILVLGGLVYFYASTLSSTRRKLEVQYRRLRLQKDKEVALKIIDREEESEVAKINAVYDSEIERLLKREEELDEIAKRGPIDIARAWEEYLSR